MAQLDNSWLQLELHFVWQSCLFLLKSLFEFVHLNSHRFQFRLQLETLRIPDRACKVCNVSDAHPFLALADGLTVSLWWSQRLTCSGVVTCFVGGVEFVGIGMGTSEGVTQSPHFSISGLINVSTFMLRLEDFWKKRIKLHQIATQLTKIICHPDPCQWRRRPSPGSFSWSVYLRFWEFRLCYTKWRGWKGLGVPNFPCSEWPEKRARLYIHFLCKVIQPLLQLPHAEHLRWYFECICDGILR